ncbi:MAG: tol-pal system protein YbgF [Myxococcales bacterium]|nr:tol-pal system protein YbgF [Myxococcales bacterium]
MRGKMLAGCGPEWGRMRGKMLAALGPGAARLGRLSLIEVMVFFALLPELGHDPHIVRAPSPEPPSPSSGSLRRRGAVSRRLLVGMLGRMLGGAPALTLTLTLAVTTTACGASRTGAGAKDARDSRELTEAVERLRVERRLRERKIRELENRLAERAVAAEPSPGIEPTLPVEIWSPDGSSVASVEDPQEPSVGERVIGVADDGSEIVYVDEAASGRVVQPSAEALAAVGRDQGRAPRRPHQGSGPLPGPAIDEGDARSLQDGDDHDRIEPLDPPSPAPLTKLGRRAARVRPSRHPVSPLPLAPVSPPVRGSTLGDAEVHYRAAVALIRAASYAEAIASLREFLSRHPTHDYADNAQYWLGEAFYAQKQYGKALVELRRVGELYPGGNKVPDALLKVGYCHLAMGDRATSTTVLRELIRLFPKSEPAVLAARKLEESSH